MGNNAETNNCPTPKGEGSKVGADFVIICAAFNTTAEYILDQTQLLYIEGDEWEESLALYPDIFQCTTTTLKRVSFTCGHSSHILDIFPLPPSDWQSIAVWIIAEEEERTEMDLRTIDAALAGSQFRTLKHFSIRGVEEFNAGLLILD
ncbi:hypothetical protein K438DRAFT_1766354 [Mycena galopus ATCC 62051]|nr:hypothetical protein K438DRAFT_1766354 [Mycena galopus ATCC 62051]